MSIATGPWNPLGQKSTKRALIYDPITFGYKVMIESNRASGDLGFAKYGGPNGRRLRCPQKISKNELSIFWSTSVPNFMLVDKSAQYPPPPKKSLRHGLYVFLLHLGA